MALGIGGIGAIVGGIGGLAGALGQGRGGQAGMSQEVADQWNLFRDASSDASNQTRLAAQGIGGLISGMPGVVGSPQLSLDPLRQAWAARESSMRGQIPRMMAQQQAGRGFGTFNASPMIADYNARRAQEMGQAAFNLPLQQYGVDRQSQQDAVRQAQVGANLYGQQAGLYGRRPGYLMNPLQMAMRLYPGQASGRTGFEQGLGMFGNVAQGAAGVMGGVNRANQQQQFLDAMRPMMFQEPDAMPSNFIGPMNQGQYRMPPPNWLSYNG